MAEAILADVNFALHSANGELAHRAGVSEPTVTRFSRAVGCVGVRELKVKLAQSLVVGRIYLEEPPRCRRQSRQADGLADHSRGHPSRHQHRRTAIGRCRFRAGGRGDCVLQQADHARRWRRIDDGRERGQASLLSPWRCRIELFRRPVDAHGRRDVGQEGCGSGDFGDRQAEGNPRRGHHRQGLRRQHHRGDEAEFAARGSSPTFHSDSTCPRRRMR